MRYAVGLDFGTESGRAVLVDLATGAELGTAIHEYANGVIDRRLPAPDDDVVLEPDWALQDPDDYIATIRATVPRLLAETGVDPADVVGLGIDFTACTMLPTTADGTPLCRLPELRREPHAWVKLWKHHAAQPEADRINAIAAARGEPWLPRYGGRISSEWFYSKGLQILDEAPQVYGAADRLIEAADWVDLAADRRRDAELVHRGLQGDLVEAGRLPVGRLLRRLDPGFAAVVDDKMSRDVRSIGERAGELSAEAAAWTGLRPGTPSRSRTSTPTSRCRPSASRRPGRWSRSWARARATSSWGRGSPSPRGCAASSRTGSSPACSATRRASRRSATSSRGSRSRPSRRDPRAGAARRLDVHAVLEREAARLRPGENGLLALDWWNGNRSILVDAELTGLLVGATMRRARPTSTGR